MKHILTILAPVILLIPAPQLIAQTDFSQPFQPSNLPQMQRLTDFHSPVWKASKMFMRGVNLGDYLEGLFGRKVDLVTPQGLSKFIGPFILKEVQYATFRD